MLKENLDYLNSIVSKPNAFGEKVTLVGATKMQSVETINQAISLGLKDVGENKPQEFRDKYPELLPVNYHFFGRLQKNKVKYLIGKACLIQSVDSLELAKEISDQSSKKQVNTKILLEVNTGEIQKGGLPLGELQSVYKQVKELPNVTICGLMCVLPSTSDEAELRKICLLIRETYDIMKSDDKNFTVLSMGMTHDYKLAIECGSNMIRIGTGIFGERNYKEKNNAPI